MVEALEGDRLRRSRVPGSNLLSERRRTVGSWPQLGKFCQRPFQAVNVYRNGLSFAVFGVLLIDSLGMHFFLLPNAVVQRCKVRTSLTFSLQPDGRVVDSRQQRPDIHIEIGRAHV